MGGARANALRELGVDHDIDVAVEELLERALQPDLIEEASARARPIPHHDVHIAVRSKVAADRRPEESETLETEVVRDPAKRRSAGELETGVRPIQRTHAAPVTARSTTVGKRSRRGALEDLSSQRAPASSLRLGERVTKLIDDLVVQLADETDARVTAKCAHGLAQLLGGKGVAVIPLDRDQLESGSGPDKARELNGGVRAHEQGYSLVPGHMVQRDDKKLGQRRCQGQPVPRTVASHETGFAEHPERRLSGAVGHPQAPRQLAQR